MLKITQAIYLNDYQVRVLFNNGDWRIFDFAPLIQRYPVFKELSDLTKFRSYKVTDTMEWNDDQIDIAPEYVYENGMAVNNRNPSK